MVREEFDNLCCDLGIFDSFGFKRHPFKNQNGINTLRHP